LAHLRKERGITQVELAERLGVSQPLVSAWERGELRLHGELIVQLTRIFDTAADQLLGLDQPPRTNGTKNRRLLRRLRAIDQLPKRDQEALIRTIDAFISKAS
jgi:transcriptional regulator with XRE-family HTH domain